MRPERSTNIKENKGQYRNADTQGDAIRGIQPFRIKREGNIVQVRTRGFEGKKASFTPQVEKVGRIAMTRGQFLPKQPIFREKVEIRTLGKGQRVFGFGNANIRIHPQVIRNSKR